MKISKVLKRAASLFLVVCLCIVIIPFMQIKTDAQKKDSFKLKVFDYNICAYVDPNNINRMFDIYPDRSMDDYTMDKRALRLKKLIDNYAPDVISLQEVNYEWFPYLTTDPSTKLTDKYAYVGVSGSGKTEGEGTARWDLYNLVFYNKEKFELLKSGDFWLSTTPDVPSRNTPSNTCMNRTCTWAILRHKESGVAYFHANTHLTTCTEEYSVQQAEVLCEQIEKLSYGLPTVITGDFNMSIYLNARAYGCMTGYGYSDSRFEAKVTKIASTWRSFGYYKTRFLQNAIDHIFVKGSITMDLYKNMTESFDADYKIIDDFDSIKQNGEKCGYDLSDHIGIYFEGTVTNDASVWNGKTPASAPDTFVKSGNTYYINSAEALAYFALSVNAGTTYSGCTVNLTKDINLLDFVWTKIGGTNGLNNPFRGVFDGCGHRIYNLNISETTERSGFFGYISVAQIRNIGIESGKVFSTGWAVGTLVGVATSESIVENCYSKADLIGNYGGMGGILGATWNVCTVRNCYYTGDISCTRTSGTPGAPITIGGIVGFVSASYGENQRVNFNGCYYAGEKPLGAYDTSKHIYIGSIYSRMATPSSSEPTATMSIDVSGCMYPYSANGTSWISASDERRVNEKAPVGYINIGMNNENAKNLNFLGGYTDDVYNLNGYYPVLKWESGKKAVLPNNEKDFFISTPEQLFSFAYNVNTGENSYSGCNVYLLNDIDLCDAPFTEIGGYDGSEKYAFKGNFNGLGHCIKNLYINSDTEKTGFFGCVSGAVTVENIGLESGSVNGKGMTGALIGNMINGVSVKKCFSRLPVFGNKEVGGLIGSAAVYSQQSVIEDCYVNAFIAGSSFKEKLISGGILGKAITDDAQSTTSHIKIYRCYFTGDWPMNSYVATATGDFKGYSVGEIAGGASSAKICISLDYCSSRYSSKNLSSEIANSSQTNTFFLYTGTNALDKTKLNSGSSANFAEDTSKINNSYPVLAWQQNGESEKLVANILSQKHIAYVSFHTIQAVRGATVTVCVNVEGNTGITDIAFDIEANGVFELVGASSPAFVTYENENADASFRGAETAAYTVAYLTFKVADVSEGDYSVIADNIVLKNGNGENVIAMGKASYIRVIDYVPGDANNDGAVDAKDAIRIKKYISDNATEINKLAADYDQNGQISMEDIQAIYKIM